MSGGRVNDLILSAVQIQAAQLEIQLRESLGQPVDDRLRQIAAAEPSPAGSASAPEVAGESAETSTKTTSADGAAPSWLLPLRRLLADDLGHGQFYRHDPLPGMPLPEQDYLFGIREALGDHWIGSQAKFKLLNVEAFSDKLHGTRESGGTFVILGGGGNPIAVQIIDNAQEFPKY